MLWVQTPIHIFPMWIFLICPSQRKVDKRKVLHLIVKVCVCLNQSNLYFVTYVIFVKFLLFVQDESLVIGVSFMNNVLNSSYGALERMFLTLVAWQADGRKRLVSRNQATKAKEWQWCLGLLLLILLPHLSLLFRLENPVLGSFLRKPILRLFL